MHGRGRTGCLLTLLIVMALAGDVGAQSGPFRIPPSEFFETVKTIALGSISVPRGLGDSAAAKAKFEPLIAAKLSHAGFSTVASQEYMEIWKRESERSGGIFHPVTGQFNESKHVAILEHTRRELNTKFNADAVLFASVRIFRIEFSQGKVAWHGASDAVEPVLSFADLLTRDYLRGFTSVLSLVVSIQTIRGLEVYVHAGGIKAIRKVSDGELVNVPPDQVFSDEARNAGAVSIALEALARKPAKQ